MVESCTFVLFFEISRSLTLHLSLFALRGVVVLHCAGVDWWHRRIEDTAGLDLYLAFGRV